MYMYLVICLKCHLEKVKGQIVIFLRGGNFLKNCLIILSLFCHEAPKDNIGDLPKDSFD